jgi:hypothetical protein
MARKVFIVSRTERGGYVGGLPPEVQQYSSAVSEAGLKSLVDSGAVVFVLALVPGEDDGLPELTVERRWRAKDGSERRRGADMSSTAPDLAVCYVGAEESHEADSPESPVGQVLQKAVYDYLQSLPNTEATKAFLNGLGICLQCGVSTKAGPCYCDSAYDE